MTTELQQLRPDEAPQVEAAWEMVRDLHDVLLARVEKYQTLHYTIVVDRQTVDFPIPITVEPVAIEMRRRSRSELVEMLANFENEYGFSTAELPDRIRSGELDETLDVRRWLSLRAIQQRIKS